MVYFSDSAVQIMFYYRTKMQALRPVIKRDRFYQEQRVGDFKQMRSTTDFFSNIPRPW